MDPINEIKEKTLPILKRYGVNKAAFFGSFARGEEKNTSDIDMLVEIEGKIGLFKFVRLKNELEDALGRKVDLVTHNALKPSLKESILKDQLVIL